MDQIAQHNIDTMKNGESIQLFIHAHLMDLTDQVVDLISVESLDVSPIGFMGMFALSTENHTAFYLERETGIVYQFRWRL